MTKKLFITITLLMMLMVFAVLATATLTTTLINPTNDDTIGGTYLFNTSNDGPTMNCTFFAQSTALTANTTKIDIGSNTTTFIAPPNSSRLITYDTALLEDGTDYTISANCTGMVAHDINTSAESTATSVVIDNTDPTTPTGASPGEGSTSTTSDVVFSATVDDATTTACDLFFNEATYSMTYSTTSCTYTVTSIPRGSYTYRIIAKDGNTSDNTQVLVSSVNIFPYQSSGGTSGYAQEYIAALTTAPEEESVISLPSLNMPPQDTSGLPSKQMFGFLIVGIGVLGLFFAPVRAILRPPLNYAAIGIGILLVVM